MNQTTIEKANSLLKRIEWLKQLKHKTSNHRELCGIGLGHVKPRKYKFNEYYLYNLTSFRFGWDKYDDEARLCEVARITIHTEICKILAEAKYELDNIGAVTIRETPKVKTSKLKKILNRIF